MSVGDAKELTKYGYQSGEFSVPGLNNPSPHPQLAIYNNTSMYSAAVKADAKREDDPDYLNLQDLVWTALRLRTPSR